MSIITSTFTFLERQFSCVPTATRLVALIMALSALLCAQAPPHTTADVVYGQDGNFTTSTVLPASANHFFGVTSVIADQTNAGSNGSIYIVDKGNSRVLYFPQGSTSATQVYGQGGNFSSSAANNGGISASSLNQPQGAALNPSGNLFVVDYINNRVLGYFAGSTTASFVYGQPGFATNTGNTGGISAGSLLNPTAAAVDSTGNLYVADSNNNRVLCYCGGLFTGTRVYGQNGSFSTGTANNGGISANSLASPYGMVFDPGGNLYVADTGNNRVLYFPAGSTTATRVYGQQGSFTTNAANKGGISANSLNFPRGLALDALGNLFVSDGNNERVLYFPAGSTTATQVYGQGGSFTTNIYNNGGISANSLASPEQITVDGAGNLYVADYGNNRVLRYNARGADVVYGQNGDFTTSAANKGGISADSLSAPNGLTTDAAGNLYAADAGNNRVLYYPAGAITATRVYGQGGSFTTGISNKDGAFTATSLSAPQDVAVDGGGNVYVADSANHRVLYYPAGATAATRFYGVFTDPVSANTLRFPGSVALDAGGNVYVSDTGDNRVLYYPAGSTTATRVYGQAGSFTSITANLGGISADSLNTPYGLALDSGGNLYVADTSNNRVLYYPAGSTTATRVYGQGGSFNTNTPFLGGPSATSLNIPYDVSLDGARNLYVSDGLGHRILYFPAGGTTATRSYGQGGSLTSGFPNNGGTSAGSLANPRGVAVDQNGSLFVADLSNNRVLKYTASGAVTVATSPSGLSFTTSGVGCAPGNYIAPQTLVWTPGSSCTLSVTTPQTTVGTRYTFTQWEDNSVLPTRAITAPSAFSTYTASFATSYQLTTSAGAGGSVSAGGFFASGSNAVITATPAAGSYFANFTGSSTSASNPLVLLMDGPKSITANFALRTAASVTPNAASKIYGQGDPALTGTLAGFLPGDNVAATYSRTAGESVAGSPYLISATLAPAGVLNKYNITYSTANFTISRATPVITWNPPAAILVGAALDATQLNATANVPGAFVYTPPAGTILPAGNGLLLSVLFTPTDSANYNPAATSTTITVNPPAGPANLIITKALTRSAGNVVVQLTVTNNGGSSAANVVVNSVKVSGVTGAPLPQAVGTIQAGASAQAIVTVPGPFGAPGTAGSLTISGTYTGGTFNTSVRITLP